MKIPENTFAEEKLKEKARKIAVKEGSAYSFMDGFGLKYITPYALSLGANNFHIGLLSSLPVLVGNFSQMLTIKVMNYWTRKKLVFTSVLLQAIMWLFLIGAGAAYYLFEINGNKMPWILIIIYTLLITLGAFSGPAWASWMRDIVTEKRGDYFGNRNRIVGGVALICMLIAGFILDYFKGTSIFIGYTIIFSIAFLGRFVSAVLFLKQYEPKFKADKRAYFTLVQFIKKMRLSNFGRFVIFVTLTLFAVNIASPFFAVYMLKDLGFSYTIYMVVILSSSVSSLLFMPVWGKFSDDYGNIKTIKITSKLIPLVPFLWIFTIYIKRSEFMVPYLIIVEIFSGMIWAGFNLAVGNFIYDAVSREKIAICSSYFNILSSIGTLIGALLGGFIASHEISFFGLNQILVLFVMSGVLRYLVYATMKNDITEVREVLDFNGSAGKEIAKITKEKLKVNKIKNKIESIKKLELIQSLDYRNLLKM